ncbi:MAG: hypothetical protein JSU65_09045 [Candidatus Zixiibacteriota bacterium]|nr:MAG: hypothetical protein JSU65_09045 [candidate division Zixibacteria bacterium]
MSVFRLLVLVAAMVCVAGIAYAVDNSGRIHGKITTVDGDEFEGMIRWDKNEASWVDVLNGTKEYRRRDYDRSRSSSRRRYRDRSRGLRLFGLRFNGDLSFSSSQSGIRFGHIGAMEIVDDDRVVLELKSGEEVELTNGSTDIGTSIREIVIEDSDEGEIEFSWDDIERIDFTRAVTDEPSALGERLYGTLTTRRGIEFTGFICWDVDEVLTKDVLDGETKRRTRKIKFGKIAAIERYSSSAAQVTLDSGEELVLRGTNDVDDSNSGILVLDPGLGQVEVEWSQFDKVTFTEPPRQVSYDDFDGGRPIKGTVYTEDGDEYTGTIRWDDDEEYTWELLNGEYRRIEFDVEFGLIKQIQKDSYRGSVVTLRDGREFELSDSNDVDEDNKGIFIFTDDGEEIVVDWEDFDRIELSE